MIHIADADIQDVRAPVAQQKSAYEIPQKVLLEMKKPNCSALRPGRAGRCNGDAVPTAHGQGARA